MFPTEEAKAAGALIALGRSVFATGLSRKEPLPTRRNAWKAFKTAGQTDA